MQLFNDNGDDASNENLTNLIKATQKQLEQENLKIKQENLKLKQEQNLTAIAEKITNSEMPPEEIKRLEDQIVQLEQVHIEKTSAKKMKEDYFNKVYKKGIGKTKKQYKLAIVDEDGNILLELKNLENIVKIANLAKEL